jgi:hypothetical protein
MGSTDEKYGGVSSAAVRAQTGKGWSEWLAILDGENARALPHNQIASLLAAKYAVPAWWSQMLTVGYEQARGLRAVHQHSDGYSANASKTFNAPLSKLYAACAEETTRVKWLGKKKHIVSKATPNKSLRITWGKDNNTRVDFNLYAKGETKSMIQIQHEKLGSATEVKQMKTYWRGALEKLAKIVES